MTYEEIKRKIKIEQILNGTFRPLLLAAIVLIIILLFVIEFNDLDLQRNLLITAFVVLLLLLYSSYTWVNNNENHIRTLPQTWTASGLLGTFIALTISFYNINVGAGEQLDINSLIHNLSLAFITSIAGILGSQFLNILINIRYDKIDKADKINETPEKMLMDLRDNSKNQNEKIITTLLELASNLNKSETSLKSLDTNFNSFKTDYRNNSKILIDNNKNQNEKIIATLLELAGNLNKSKTSLKSLDTNFNNLKTDLSNMFSGAMQNFNTSMQSDISEINEQIKEHVIALQKNFSTLTGESIKEFQKHNSTVKEEINKNLKDILKTHTTELLTIQKDIKKQMEGFLTEVKLGNEKALVQQKEEAVQRNEDIKEISSAIIDSGNNTKESLDTIVSEFKIGMKDLLKDVVKVNDEVLAQQKKEIEQRSEDLKNINESIITSTKSNNKKLKKIANEIITSTSVSLESFKLANKKLLEQQKSEATQRGTAIETINNSIIESGKSAKEAFDSIAASMAEKTVELVGSITKELDTLLDAIKYHASVSENAVKASSARLVEAANKYDKSVDTQTGVLKNSAAILDQLKTLIAQREDEFNKYKYFEERLNNNQ